MSPDNAQTIFQAAEKILDDVRNDVVDRMPMKTLAQKIADQTGITLSKVTSTVRLYVKNSPDLAFQRGRAGGVRKAISVMAKNQLIDKNQAIDISDSSEETDLSSSSEENV